MPLQGSPSLAKICSDVRTPQFCIQIRKAQMLTADPWLKAGRRCVILGLILSLAAGPLCGGEIMTIAGNGRAGSSGDGGSAREAGIGEPFGLVIGPDQALYVCEVKNHKVRRIDERTGFITTVLGLGVAGYDGDGGIATRASCNEPYEVRFDQHGNMFVVEMQNHLVRRVEAKTGIVTTVAGSGRPGFSGDGGPAAKARLKQPHSIALDGAGSLYIADIGNHRIRRVDLKSGIIETFAGTGERALAADGAPLAGTPLDGPRAIDFDSRGQMYLALREGNAVFRIDPRARVLHHLAGTGSPGYTGDNGPARKARLKGPKGIAVGPGGDLYLADTESHTIRVIRAASGNIETLVGDGTPGDGPDGDPRRCRLHRPHGVFVDEKGNLYIGDSSNNRVRKLPVDPN
jgi:streptogramin lyase